MVLHFVGAQPIKEGTGRIARFELIPLQVRYIPTRFYQVQEGQMQLCSYRGFSSVLLFFLFIHCLLMHWPHFAPLCTFALGLMTRRQALLVRSLVDTL